MRAALATAVALVLAAACGGEPGSPDTANLLRVCADPNNLPFSNDRLEGFENELASLVGDELGVTVEYTWWAQRRGFVRNTLDAGRCEVLMGVPASMERVLTTRPYYRSSYVFVHRADAELRPRSFDDPGLRDARIGVPLVGDDGSNPPPIHALARRDIVENLRGYPVYGDYSEPDPPARLIDAVAEGEVDVAIAWGPLAGYFAERQPVELTVRPVSPPIEPPFLPMVFDIAMGVQRADTALMERLDGIIRARRDEISALLDEYGVPRVEADVPGAGAPTGAVRTGR